MKAPYSKQWKSLATWPPEVQLGNSFNQSEDWHDTYEQAESVCRMLETQGFGGEGLIFPIATKVFPPSVLPAEQAGEGESDTPRADKLEYEEACNFDVPWSDEYRTIERQLSAALSERDEARKERDEAASSLSIAYLSRDRARKALVDSDKELSRLRILMDRIGVPSGFEDGNSWDDYSLSEQAGMAEKLFVTLRSERDALRAQVEELKRAVHTAEYFNNQQREQWHKEADSLRAQFAKLKSDAEGLAKAAQERVDAKAEYDSDPKATCLRCGMADRGLETALATFRAANLSPETEEGK